MDVVTLCTTFSFYSLNLSFDPYGFTLDWNVETSVCHSLLELQSIYNQLCVTAKMDREIVMYVSLKISGLVEDRRILVFFNWLNCNIGIFLIFEPRFWSLYIYIFFFCNSSYHIIENI